MKPFTYFLSLFFLFSCNNRPKDQIKKETIKNEVINADNVIDYKKTDYRFFIGETIDSIENTVHLSHNYMADDGKINDLGITNYMTLGEDLTKPNDDLPALFFKTDHKKLVKFECSIIGTYAQDDMKGFVKTLESLFGSLSLENQQILHEKYLLDLSKAGYTERFTLDTTGRKHDVLFRYVKELK